MEHVQHEPRRRGLGQLGDGELLQFKTEWTARKVLCHSSPTTGVPNAAIAFD